MEENFDDGLVSHTDTSPLKTIQLDYQRPGCSKEYDEDSDSSGKIPSYQLPPKTEKEQAVEEEKHSDAKRERKAEAEVTSSAEAKIRKTEESVRKIKRHLDKKTCPKSLRYNVRANIPPDEQFKKDIQAVKQKAEQGFISALTKFHYRRLEQQKNKFQRDKTNARHIGSLNEKGLSNKSRKKSPTADIANVSTLAAN